MYSGPTIQSRSAAQRAAQDLVYKRNTNYPNMWKLAIFDILTLITSTDQTRPFTHDLVIFHTRPHVGWVWKITKS